MRLSGRFSAIPDLFNEPKCHLLLLIVASLVCLFFLLLDVRSVSAQDDGWKWEMPLPQGNTLNDVWSSSNTSDVFAVGDYGTILHHDGEAWSIMESGTTVNLRGVWGSDPQSVFAVGLTNAEDNEYEILHFDGQDWRAMVNNTNVAAVAVWGTAADDVYAVGGEGILHYDGVDWTVVFEYEVGYLGLTDVWGVAPDDIYAVGLGGVFHFDGSAWNKVDAGLDRFSLDSVWASSSDDVYGIDRYTVYHFDGTSWSKMTSLHEDGWAPIDLGIDGSLQKIRGIDADNVYVVNWYGEIAYYNGDSWQPMETPERTRQLYGIAGSQPDNLFVVGVAGQVLHYDGATWALPENTFYYDYARIDGSGPDDIWVPIATGTTFLHFDGNDWTDVWTEQDVALSGVWVNGPNDLFALGLDVANFVAAILHYDGEEWLRTDIGGGYMLDSIWGSARDDVYAAGMEFSSYPREALLHYDGIEWTPVKIGDQGTFADIHGSGPDNVYAIGTHYVLHFDGNEWREVDELSRFAENDAFLAVMAAAEDDVFIGTRDSILHFDGENWNHSPIGAAINGFWGTHDEAFAVGGQSIFHFDGHSWVRISDVPALSGLTRIWGPDRANLYAVGSGGILHFGGDEITHHYSYLPIVAEQLQNENRVALVVRHGDGEVVTRCVDIDGQSATGLDVLAASGLGPNIEMQSSGAAVCSLDREGCEFPTESCFCACTSDPCFYWSYWQLEQNEWTYSQQGASNREIVAGSVEGWSWSEGTIGKGAVQPPPVESFTSICSVTGF